MCEEYPQELQVTAKQRSRADDFGLRIFSPELPGYGPTYFTFTRSNLLKRFGQPLRTKSRERLAYDPGDPMEILTTWEYRGFRITTRASKPKPDEVQLEEGEIFGANISLRYGVRIGQTIDRWVRQFGQPNCSERHLANEEEFHLVYESDYSPCGRNTTCDGPYQVDMFLDGSGKVKSIKWSYPMM
jgi:hypothetical protein